MMPPPVFAWRLHITHTLPAAAVITPIHPSLASLLVPPTFVQIEKEMLTTINVNEIR